MNQNIFGKYRNNIIAKSREEFVSILNDINNKVQEKNKGRTKDEIERSDIIHYLKSLAINDIFKYPIDIRKNESPDFIIKFADSQIGVEHTSSTNKKIELFKIEVEKSDKPLTYNLRGYFGNQVEYECSEMLYYSILYKTQKLNTESFKKFQLNELLIYYDGPVIGMNRELTIDIMKNKLLKSDYYKFQLKFDVISVIISWDLLYDIFGDLKIYR